MLQPGALENRGAAREVKGVAGESSEEVEILLLGSDHLRNEVGIS